MLIAVCTQLSSHGLQRIASQIDAIEIRMDLLTESEKQQLPEFLAQWGRPWILTVRQGTFATIAPWLAFNPTYCDLEEAIDPTPFIPLAQRYPSIRWIRSHHNFTMTPTALSSIRKAMEHPLFFHYKMAFHALSSLDLFRLLEAASENSHTSWIALGIHGEPSRILGPMYGNLLNYAAFHPAVALNGQLSVEELHTTYRYASLHSQTQIYALLGNPIAHSWGPLFHNRSLPTDTVYLKWPLKKEELPLFRSASTRLLLKGLSITAPLKETILPYLDAIDSKARPLGCVNTVRITSQGQWIGTNTDAPATLNVIESILRVRGRHLVLLGAGGSARAIAYEARQRGAHLTWLNRTPEKPQALLAEWGGHAAPLETLSELSYDILVNTIPAHLNPLPIHPDHIRPSLLLDLNYSPNPLPLLEEGKKRGCLALNGERVFFEQAHLQQKYWLQ